MIYLLVFLSGFAGLVYEIVWIKRASLAFGSSSLALSTVLAVFFLGLGLGSYGFGRLGAKTARPLLWCAGLEILLALYGLSNPVLFGWAEDTFGAIYNRYSLDSAGLLTLRAGLIALLLLPPTLLMGGTLPLFCRRLVHDRFTIAAKIGQIYGINTLGATLGCAFTGFGLIPWFGVAAATFVAATVNLLAAFGFYGLSRVVDVRPASVDASLPGGKAASTDRPHPTHSSPAIIRPQGEGFLVAGHVVMTGLLFLLIGAVALANELVWARFLGNFIRNTVYTYTIALTVVLAGTVIGSLLAAPLYDRNRERRTLLHWFAVLQATSALLTLLLTHLPALWWQSLREWGGLPFIVLMLPPAIISGASFPLANRLVIADPAHAARDVGRMTALNILGCIAGSLLTGFLLLPRYGLDISLYATTGVGMLTALIALAAGLMRDSARAGATALLLAKEDVLSASAAGRSDFVPPRPDEARSGGDGHWPSARRPLVATAFVAACAGLWLLMPTLSPVRIPQDFIGTPATLVDFSEGYNSTLAAIKRDEATVMLVNQLWQGSSRKNHQIMAAHIPMVHYPAAKDVLVVGLGVGQTASRFLQYPVRQLDIVDIEPRLFDFVRKNFDSAWMDDARVRLIAEDGRGYVNHTQRRYDILSVEVGQLYRPGVDVFYTREFYGQARTRLSRDGMIVQFVPLGFLREAELGSILKTFLSVFPKSSLWYNGSELLLMGFNGQEHKLSEGDHAGLLADQRLRADMEFAHWGGPGYRQNRFPVFLGGFLASGPELLALADRPGATLYTDDKPLLAYAVSDFEMGDQRAAAMAPIVAQHLSPIGQMLASAPDNATIQAAEAVRRLNIGDLVAGDILDHINPPDIDTRAEEIRPRIEEALRHNPKNLRGLKLMGDALIALNREQAAIPYFQRVLEQDENDALARRALAFALAKGGRFEAAIPHLERALKTLPDDPETLNTLAVALINLNRIEDALPYFRRAVLVAPGNSAARQNLQNAELMLRQRQPH